MEKVTTHQAKTQLSQLIKRAQAGEDIVVCRGDLPVVRLVPVDPIGTPTGRPKVGTITSGPITLTADAFSPLTDQELDEWGL
jgi:prevent-host-death family protein